MCRRPGALRHPQGGDAGGRGRTSARSSRSDRAWSHWGRTRSCRGTRWGRWTPSTSPPAIWARCAPRARRGCWWPARARARRSGRGSQLDALVLSGDDAIERRQAERAQEEAELVVFTEGARGGAYRERSGESGTWTAAPLPAAAVDSYGCGDSFAAGLTYGLGAGLDVPDALALAARCGAMCLTGSGPYEHQLTEADL